MVRSFRFQIFIILLLAVVLASVATGWLAYHFSSEMISRGTIQTVELAAQERQQALKKKLEWQKRRAEGFLLTAHRACTHAGILQRKCLTTLFRGFVKTEGVNDAYLACETIPPVLLGPSSGQLSALAKPSAQHLATFVRDVSGQSAYILTATQAKIGKIILKFGINEIQEILSTPPQLGKTGETFLADSRGFFITAPRYASTSIQSHPIDAEPMKHCLTQHSGHSLALDYRGVPVIHGYQYVPEIGGGCIMAHIEQGEAFAPLSTLKREVFGISLVFSIIAIFIASLRARQIGPPLEHLAQRARAAQQGDLESPVPIEGPTEIQTLGKAFASTTATLNHMLRDREDFVSIVSHDLRNPTAGILLNCQAMLRKYGDGGTTEIENHLLAAIKRIEKSAVQAKKLIEDLLDLAVVQSGQLRLHKETHDVIAAVNDAYEMVLPIAKEKSIRLEQKIPATQCLTSFDQERMCQVFSNILGNAIKFTPEGGTVTIGLRSCAPEVVIAVRDTGPGISEGELPHLFDRFWQSQRKRKAGAGLGLYISKAIMEAHGGRIFVESSIGKGSTFYCALPYTEALSAQKKAG